MVATVIDAAVSQSIKIGDVVINILKMQNNDEIVRFGIDAPRNIPIHRLEIYQRIQGERHGKSKQES